MRTLDSSGKYKKVLQKFIADNLDYYDCMQCIDDMAYEQLLIVMGRVEYNVKKKNQNISVVKEITKKQLIRKVEASEYTQKPQSVIKCCLHCGSVNFKKHGTTKGGVQRYICKDCGKSFSENYGLITHYTHLQEWQWQEIIRGTVNGESITKIAKNIDVSTSTVWSCRLKVYQNIMNIYGYCDTFNNIVEADGKYERISFKGCKDKNYFIDKLKRLPRHHRSKSERIEYLDRCGRYEELFKTNPKLLHEMLFSSQKNLTGLDTIDKKHQEACILTAIDRSNNMYIKPITAGTPNAKDIYNSLTTKIEKDAVLVTDGHSGYSYYSRTENITHIKVVGGYQSNNAFNVNRVNGLHSSIDRFFGCKEYKPATKYLDLYLIMFWWLQKNKDLKSSDMYQKLYDIMTGHVENEVRAKMTRVTIDCLVSRPLPIDTKGFY